MHTETVFGGITVRYEPQMVHIDTDHTLMDFLAQRGNGSRALARSILAQYRTLFDAPMQITERSMATEILIHAYLDVLFAWARRTGARLGRAGRRLGAWGARMQAHTAMIDIGERTVDTNRHIFDRLSRAYWLLRVLLGKWA